MSTTDFDIEKFNELISDFYKIKKRVLQNRPISSDKSKIKEYIYLLVETYNNILSYTSPHNDQFSISLKSSIHKKILYCRELLLKCLRKLECKIKVPYGVNLFQLVEREDLMNSESKIDILNDDKDKLEVERKVGNDIGLEDGNSLNIFKMATIEEKTKFISMCSNIIRENYDGNPLTLNSFIDKINLIEELTASNLNTCFISFLKSKLDGKAREVLPENISSVDQIKNALKNRIKPDNSKVVAGRIASLNVKQNNYADFAKNVEELADALERSLVIEGITKDKAHEMATEQTINVCRSNAKSDMVKAILASTAFKEPKDVVAKLIVEESNTERQTQVLSMRYSKNRSNFYHKNNNYQPSRGNNHNNYRNRSYNKNNNYNNYNNYDRSQGRNYNNRGRCDNRSYHTSPYGQNTRNNFRRQDASVRTLNLEGPQQDMLREEERMLREEEH